MITYTEGDATLPQGDGRKIIAHVCNNAGAWGAGFVMALSARDRGPERAYRAWELGSLDYAIGLRQSNRFRLGEIQICSFDRENQPLVWVCNMIAQEDTSWAGIRPPIRYGALAQCLALLRNQAKFGIASVHMPRIGCGLAGGTWDVVERLINKHLHDVPVTVYDLPVINLVP
jgi:O-acetyl-ADP-ribose deacetylase (regulator of RNase III)